jgi:hypothetical protein
MTSWVDWRVRPDLVNQHDKAESLNPHAYAHCRFGEEADKLLFCCNSTGADNVLEIFVITSKGGIETTAFCRKNETVVQPGPFVDILCTEPFQTISVKSGIRVVTQPRGCDVFLRMIVVALSVGFLF